MESMVEENGNSSLDPLGVGDVANQVGVPANLSATSLSDCVTSQQSASSGTTLLTTSANIVQFIPASSIQVYVMYNIYIYIKFKFVFIKPLFSFLVQNT